MTTTLLKFLRVFAAAAAIGIASPNPSAFAQSANVLPSGDTAQWKSIGALRLS